MNNDNETIDITEPPYPSLTCRWPEVYKSLKGLRGWVNYHRTGINTVAGTELIREPPDLLPLNAFGDLPAVTFYQDILVVRRIRESWDQIVRDFGSSNALWSSPNCLARRRELVLLAFYFLVAEATMSAETREAKIEKSQKAAINSSIGNLISVFDKLFAFRPSPDQE